jgi:hypothetical protein
MADINILAGKKSIIDKKQDMITALERRQPEPRTAVPIWELEFHLWDKFSGGHLKLGSAFEKLTPKKQDKALRTNAEILIDVSEKLNFAAITVPGGYWEVASGEPAYLWLPEKARLKQIKILRRMAPDFMLITGASN